MWNIKALLLLAMVSLTLGRASETNDEKRLIKVSEEQPAAWLSQDEIFTLLRERTNFIDITDIDFPTVVKEVPTHAIPTTIRFQSIVAAALTKLNIARIQTFVDTFDNYNNRYYTSQTGVAASEWVLAQATSSIANSGYRGNASARAFTHTWAQSSVIARIEGSDPTLRGEVVIFGAHMDSVNSGSPAAGRAPGSDDNASGSSTVLESFRIILESGVIPKRSTEFHWYAAEEVGLRGSAAIAQSYSNTGVDVVAMINFDVVGYNAGSIAIGFISDNTNLVLTRFMKLVSESYCAYPWIDYRCGYGCSDHASFNSFGFPAASPVESPLSPYMHGTRDTIDTVNFIQIGEFVKLAVGTAIEIAEPTSL